MMLPSYTMVDFRLFYDGPVDIQLWALLTRSQCKVSDTQVTVKACGPLVRNEMMKIKQQKLVIHIQGGLRLLICILF